MLFSFKVGAARQVVFCVDLRSIKRGCYWPFPRYGLVILSADNDLSAKQAIRLDGDSFVWVGRPQFLSLRHTRSAESWGG